jgi:hypothetical protein
MNMRPQAWIFRKAPLFIAVLLLPYALSGSVCLSEHGVAAFGFTPCGCDVHAGTPQPSVGLEATPECGACHDYWLPAMASRWLPALPDGGPFDLSRSTEVSSEPSISPIVDTSTRAIESPGSRHSILRC